MYVFVSVKPTCSKKGVNTTSRKYRYIKSYDCCTYDNAIDILTRPVHYRIWETTAANLQLPVTAWLATSREICPALTRQT